MSPQHSGSESTLPTGILFDGCHGLDFNLGRLITLANQHGAGIELPGEEADHFLGRFTPPGYWAGWTAGTTGSGRTRSPRWATRS